MVNSLTDNLRNSLTSYLGNKLSQTLIALALVSCFTVSYQVSAAKEAIALTGEVKQGGLMVGKTLAQNTVTLNGKTITVSNKGDFTFGFSRDDIQSYQLVITSVNGDRVEKTLTPQKRSYNIQRIEGIKKSIMQPDPKAVARAQLDSKQVKTARKVASSLNYFAHGFVAPIEGTITGVYGSQRVYNGVPKNPHFGLDYAGKTGDPVKAPASGTVLLWVPDMFYSGGTMIIDHGQGVSSTFLHLSNSYVKQGDKIKQGQVVAAVGKSGRATGPHLDWRINWFDVKIDPALVLKIQPLH
ncbi:M23 family metallopeptidase [Colwellia sp. 12G3]|uniref:M23 family metallopeptidase n=1 Tax=Colwellia sp. 12G3 TaxID=2058299 RepID=UPI000C3326C8|nr:M23 family metallopeptidase [Colwellia sp. 12G3]PKI16221.1 peptidase [Colwellia sp. 12G3]